MGEGGVTVTDDDQIARLCRSMSNQGRGEAGVWLSHKRLGYNYRMDELSAALGVARMWRIEEIIAKRERVAVMRRGAYRTCRPSAWRGCRASTCLVWRPTRLPGARLPYVAPEDTMFAERLAKRPGLTLPCVAVVWRPR